MEDIIQLAKEALSQSETFGNYGPMVGLVASAALAATFLIQIVAGKFGLIPDVPERPLLLRVEAGLALAGLMFLTAVENGPAAGSVDFLSVALWSIVAAVAGVLLYLLWARHLVVATKEWPETPNVLGGPWLTPEARAYREQHETSLPDTLASFGNQLEDVGLVWPRSSLNAGIVIMFLATSGIGLGLAGTVAALAFDMLDIRVEQENAEDGGTRIIRFPSHFVFATGESAIADMDTSALEGELEAILEFGPTRIEVHGHADGQGDEETNQALSEDRASAVKAWLEAQPRLADVPVTAAGFGETRQRFPEAGLTGDDLRDARRGNRRVEIVLSRE